LSARNGAFTAPVRTRLLRVDVLLDRLGSTDVFRDSLAVVLLLLVIGGI